MKTKKDEFKVNYSKGSQYKDFIPTQVKEVDKRIINNLTGLKNKPVSSQFWQKPAYTITFPICNSENIQKINMYAETSVINAILKTEAVLKIKGEDQDVKRKTKKLDKVVDDLENKKDDKSKNLELLEYLWSIETSYRDSFNITYPNSLKYIFSNKSDSEVKLEDNEIIEQRLENMIVYKKIFFEYLANKEFSDNCQKFSLLNFILKNYQKACLLKLAFDKYKDKTTFQIYLDEEKRFYYQKDCPDSFFSSVNDNHHSSKNVLDNSNNNSHNVEDIGIVRSRKFHKSFFNMFDEKSNHFVVKIKSRPETEEEKTARINNLFPNYFANKFTKTLNKQQDKQKMLLIEEIEKPNMIDEIDNTKINISSPKNNKFNIWFGSCFQMILDYNLKDVNNNETIFQKIFPQKNGLPVRSDYGKYAIKLLYQGEYYLVEIDDMFPFQLTSLNCLLPETDSGVEIWPMLIMKALIKLCSHKISIFKHENELFPEKIMEVGNAAIYYFLFGYCSLLTPKAMINENNLFLESFLNDNNHIYKNKLLLCFGLNLEQEELKSNKHKSNNHSTNQSIKEEYQSSNVLHYKLSSVDNSNFKGLTNEKYIRQSVDEIDENNISVEKIRVNRKINSLLSSSSNNISGVIKNSCIGFNHIFNKTNTFVPQIKHRDSQRPSNVNLEILKRLSVANKDPHKQTDHKRHRDTFANKIQNKDENKLLENNDKQRKSKNFEQMKTKVERYRTSILGSISPSEKNNVKIIDNNEIEIENLYKFSNEILLSSKEYDAVKLRRNSISNVRDIFDKKVCNAKLEEIVRSVLGNKGSESRKIQKRATLSLPEVEKVNNIHKSSILDKKLSYKEVLFNMPTCLDDKGNIVLLKPIFSTNIKTNTIVNCSSMSDFFKKEVINNNKIKGNAKFYIDSLHEVSKVEHALDLMYKVTISKYFSTHSLESYQKFINYKARLVLDRESFRAKEEELKNVITNYIVNENNSIFQSSEYFLFRETRNTVFGIEYLLNNIPGNLKSNKNKKSTKALKELNPKVKLEGEESKTKPFYSNFIQKLKNKTSFLENKTLLTNKRIYQFSICVVTDFFHNHSFNVSCLKPLDFSDLSKKLTDNKISYKTLTKKEKKDYLEKIIKLRTEIKNEKMKRIKNLVEFTGEQVYYVNIYGYGLSLFIEKENASPSLQNNSPLDMKNIIENKPEITPEPVKKYKSTMTIKLSDSKLNLKNFNISPKKTKTNFANEIIKPVEYNRDQILMGKKCILNNWKIPPPDFFDDMLEKLEKEKLKEMELEKEREKEKLTKEKKSPTENKKRMSKQKTSSPSPNSHVKRKKTVDNSQSIVENKKMNDSEVKNISPIGKPKKKFDLSKSKILEDDELLLLMNESNENLVKKNNTNENNDTLFHTTDLEKKEKNKKVHKPKDKWNKETYLSVVEDLSIFKNNVKQVLERKPEGCWYKLEALQKNFKYLVILWSCKNFKNNMQVQSIQTNLIEIERPFFIPEVNIPSKFATSNITKPNKNVDTSLNKTKNLILEDSKYNTIFQLNENLEVILFQPNSQLDITDNNDKEVRRMGDKKQTTKKLRKTTVKNLPTLENAREQNSRQETCNNMLGKSNKSSLIIIFDSISAKQKVQKTDSKNKDKSVISESEVVNYANYELRNENHDVIKKFSFVGTHHTEYFDGLNPLESFYLILISYFSPLGFNLTIYSDHILDFINHNNFLTKYMNFNKYTIQTNHPLIEKNSFFVIGKIELNLSELQVNSDERVDKVEKLQTDTNKITKMQLKIVTSCTSKKLNSIIKIILISKYDEQNTYNEEKNKANLNYSIINKTNSNNMLSYLNNTNLEYITDNEEEYNNLGNKRIFHNSTSKQKSMNQIEFQEHGLTNNKSYSKTILQNEILLLNKKTNYLLIFAVENDDEVIAEGNLEITILSSDKLDNKIRLLDMVEPFEIRDVFKINKGNFLFKDFIFPANQVSVTMVVNLLIYNKAKSLKSMEKFFNNPDNKKENKALFTMSKKDKEKILIDPLNSVFAHLEYFTKLKVKLRLEILNSLTGKSVYVSEFYNHNKIHNLQLSKILYNNTNYVDELTNRKKSNFVNSDRKKTIAKVDRSSINLNATEYNSVNVDNDHAKIYLNVFDSIFPYEINCTVTGVVFEDDVRSYKEISKPNFDLNKYLLSFNNQGSININNFAKSPNSNSQISHKSPKVNKANKLIFREETKDDNKNNNNNSSSEESNNEEEQREFLFQEGDEIVFNISVFASDNLILTKNLCKEEAEKLMIDGWEFNEPSRKVKAKIARNAFKKCNKYNLINQDPEVKNYFKIIGREEIMRHANEIKDQIRTGSLGDFYSLNSSKATNTTDTVKYEALKIMSKDSDKNKSNKITGNIYKENINEGNNKIYKLKTDEILEVKLRERKRFYFDNNQNSDIATLQFEDPDALTKANSINERVEKQNNDIKFKKLNNKNLFNTKSNNKLVETKLGVYDFRNNSINSHKVLKKPENYKNNSFKDFINYSTITRSHLINHDADFLKNGKYISNIYLTITFFLFDMLFLIEFSHRNDLPVLNEKTKLISEEFNKTYNNWKCFAEDNLIKTMYNHKLNNNNLNKSAIEPKTNNLLLKQADGNKTINSKLDESVLSNKDKSNSIIKVNKLMIFNDEYNKTYNEYFNSISTRSNFNSKVNNILSSRANMIDKRMLEINNEKLLKEILNYFDSYDLIKYVIPQYNTLKLSGYYSSNMNKLLMKISEKREKTMVSDLSSGKLKDKEAIKKLLEEIQLNSYIFTEETLNLLSEKIK